MRRPKSEPEKRHHEAAGRLRRGPARVSTRARDIEIQQLELELQNHKLRDARRALEESRRRYVDLYDFAPVAYLTLDSVGRIKEANLTASRSSTSIQMAAKSCSAVGVQTTVYLMTA